MGILLAAAVSLLIITASVPTTKKSEDYVSQLAIRISGLTADCPHNWRRIALLLGLLSITISYQLPDCHQPSRTATG